MRLFFIIISFFLTIAKAQEPQITNFYPGFNAGVNSADSIMIQFNTPIDTTGITHNIIVFTQFSTTKTFTYFYNENENRLYLKPLHTFFTGEEVTVTITTRLTTLNGNSFNGFVWSFNIIPALQKEINFSDPKIKNEFLGDYILPLDLNNDQYPEMIIGNNVLLNDRIMDFTLHQALPIELLKPLIGLCTSDVNLNHRPEIYVFGLFNNENYEKAKDGFFYGNTGIETARYKDINLDGKPDKIFLGIIQPGDTTNFIGINLNDGEGVLSSNTDTLVIDKNIVSIEFEDMNNDGILDLIYTTNSFATGYGSGGDKKIVIIFMNSSNAAYEQYILRDADLQDGLGFGYFTQLNIRDFNNDSYNDIHVITNSEDYIFYNNKMNGLKTDEAQVVITGGGDSPHGAIPADINGDGWMDIIMYFSLIPEEYTEFYILQNPKDSTNNFWSFYNNGVMVEKSEPARINSFFAADFNNDGLLDIASAWNDGLHISYGDIANAISTQNNTHAACFKIKTNYPNPFNRTTLLPFEIMRTTFINSVIYSSNGKEVYRYKEKIFVPGSYSLTWTGTNNNGEGVSNGVYYWKVSSRKFSKVLKLTLLK